jgi:uncharacterized protein YndB with AHSA1/START domain
MGYAMLEARMTSIGPYHVRRSVWIDAAPDVVWKRFETFDDMRSWYGTGHTLTRYEPQLGGMVETTVDVDGTTHRFRGQITVFEACRELTFEQLWEGSSWLHPTLVTIRLAPLDEGTLVELFHHGYEQLGTPIGDTLDGFESGWTNRQVHALRDLVSI